MTVDDKIKDDRIKFYKQGIAGSVALMLTGFEMKSQPVVYASVVSGIGFSGALVYEHNRDKIKSYLSRLKRDNAISRTDTC